MSEDTERFLLLQKKYSKSLFWAENLNFQPITVNNLFKFSAQDRDLEYPPVPSDLKPPLASALKNVNLNTRKTSMLALKCTFLCQNRPKHTQLDMCEKE